MFKHVLFFILVAWFSLAHCRPSCSENVCSKINACPADVGCRVDPVTCRPICIKNLCPNLCKNSNCPQGTRCVERPFCTFECESDKDQIIKDNKGLLALKKKIVLSDAPTEDVEEMSIGIPPPVVPNEEKMNKEVENKKEVQREEKKISEKKKVEIPKVEVKKNQKSEAEMEKDPMSEEEKENDPMPEEEMEKDPMVEEEEMEEDPMVEEEEMEEDPMPEDKVEKNEKSEEEKKEAMFDKRL